LAQIWLSGRSQRPGSQSKRLAKTIHALNVLHRSQDTFSLGL